jgi:tungstate transport system substrate-binding protein
MAEGYGRDRLLVMHNDFVLVGPAADPARSTTAPTAVDALRAIAARGATFISRGDNSGTHALELKLWRATGIEPGRQGWYQESGQGMGATLQIADQKAAYTITDRATFLAVRKNLALAVVNEGDRAYFNVYHVITLNSERSPRANLEGALAFARFLVGKEAQAVIETFGFDRYGQALFVPDAGKSAAELGVQ